MDNLPTSKHASTRPGARTAANQYVDPVGRLEVPVSSTWRLTLLDGGGSEGLWTRSAQDLQVCSRSAVVKVVRVLPASGRIWVTRLDGTKMVDPRLYFYFAPVRRAQVATSFQPLFMRRSWLLTPVYGHKHGESIEQTPRWFTTSGCPAVKGSAVPG